MILIMLTLPAQACGQDADSIDRYFIPDLAEYFSRPSHWEGGRWLELAGMTGGVLLTSELLDEPWKDTINKNNRRLAFPRTGFVGNGWGDMSLSGPFMLGVYSYGRWTEDSRYTRAAFNMVQSVAYSGVAVTLLKIAFGRIRPDKALEETSWFMGGNSFPSGHTSVAFAVSRSYLNSLDHPSLVTQGLFYGLATSTAFARTYDNRHWVSDVVAGALLGIFTADFVSDRNRKRQAGIGYFPHIDGETVGIAMNWIWG